MKRETPFLLQRFATVARTIALWRSSFGDGLAAKMALEAIGRPRSYSTESIAAYKTAFGK